MGEVVRSARDYQEVTYTLDRDAVKSAICAYLYDEHSGSFTPETTIRFGADGSVIIATIFESHEAASSTESAGHG